MLTGQSELENAEMETFTLGYIKLTTKTNENISLRNFLGEKQEIFS